MNEEYNFKGVNFNELEDSEAIASYNRFQNQENEIIKQKEKEEKAKEKKLKQEKEKELKEQKEKELREQKEKEKLEKEKEKQDKELKRKRNINDTNDTKNTNNNKLMNRNKKDMTDDDAVVVTDAKFETLGTNNKKSDSNISKNDIINSSTKVDNKDKDKKETIKITEEVIVDEVKSRNTKNNSKGGNSNSNEL